MRFSLKGISRLLLGFGLLACVLGLHGELTRWAENVEAGSRLESVFFKPGMRRPPVETRVELTRLIAAAPAGEELYPLRALEEEQQLDFAAAEADWKKLIDVSKDKGAARIALADYYHRRLQSNDELAALALAARENGPDSDKLLPPAGQRPWKIYQRLIQLVDDQRLDSSLGGDQYAAWVERYPNEPGVYQGYFHYAMDHARYDIAGFVIAGYQRRFPQDEEFSIEAQAEVTARIGTPEQAVALYQKKFRPLWPSTLVAKYFELLKQTGQLRVYLDQARAAVAANPADVSSAARLFFYWQQQGNAAAADRVLAEYRARKTSWTPAELLTLGRLFESTHNYDEAARNYYALYTASANDAALAETALASLARLLLSAPEQAIHFGSGDLTLYRDAAAMDPHPGFLNGVLSLILNDSDAGQHYALEEQAAAPYFRRARAAELVGLFETRFPASPQRADLRERVIEAYAIYGASDGVIRAGTKFLTDFADAPNRVAVAMRVADAYARLNRTPQEFAVYDSLLQELARRADGVPMGAIPAGAEKAAADKLRSPEYARVLDRYVARLVSLQRVRDALALYRREIDRNPNDPGLYDTLAAFLDQNKLGAEAEAVYKRAIAQFPDPTWDHKLARWYLRQKRAADVGRLTRDVVKTFSGTELEAYFKDVVKSAAPLGPALALQLNVFAHQRFPHQLTLVRNLLGAYSTGITRNDAAYETLLRQNWFYADDLRQRFFERLSRTGKLDAELAAAKADSRMQAEGEIWRGHFEAAAPAMLAIEASFPADQSIGARTAAVYRSIGRLETGIAIEEKLTQADPRDHAALTRLGEMEAERGRFDRATADWNRLSLIDPAKADAYLEQATVFWDYYRYDDALRVINDARTRLARPTLFAYEAGAIRENQRAYDAAAREYARGAMAQPDSAAQARLLLLARRPATRADIEQLTANLVSARNPQLGALHVRVALLRNQNRRDELEKVFLDVADRANSPEVLAAIETDARVDGFPKAQQKAIERQIAIAADPVGKLRLRLSLARFFEGQGQIAQGAATVDALYRENPAIVGVIRADVDYQWRNKNPRRAVDVLEQASARAAGAYREPFMLEAARKATESADYTRARAFAQKLLAVAPDNAEYVAAMADTYARQGDDRGLRTFYAAKIRDTRNVEQVAAMRRALIPVLTRMKDFSAGVDQYIEVLNRYPDDDGLAREAALYASSNGAGARLRDYYVKAANDSPEDYRWPMLLARIDSGLEDFPSAIAAYTRASAVRPDRTDLLSDRLNLEVRLLRFDDAASIATKLYELSYRNPAWMERLAEIRARQGRNTDAVAALRKAWIDGRAPSADNLVSIARRLDSWGMLADARRFAEQALKLSPESGQPAWTRIAMRQRESVAVLLKLAGAKDDAAPALAAEIGRVVREEYSPEEKVRFAAALTQNPRRVELAGEAGLVDVQARWIAERMLAKPADEKVMEWKQNLIEIQEGRLAFAEMGAQLEAFARLPNVDGVDEITRAAAAYRAAGNTGAELRALQLLNDNAPIEGAVFERYAQLLMVQPARFMAAITREKRPEVANALVNYAVDHGTAAAAQQAVAARGARMGALWTKGYTALTGMYFASNTAPVKAAFTSILGDMTIGARIGKPVDRNAQLAGDWWFYYAGRYGEYSASADFLPAMVEANPAKSDGYFALAEYFRGAGNAAAALPDYRGALELKPSRADAHDRLAMLAASKEDAVKEWKLAIAALLDQMNSAHVPQAFWGDFNDTLHHIGAAKALPELRADIDQVLRLYIRRNGAFQIEPLFEGVLAAGGDVAWIGELSMAAADPARLLLSVIDRPFIPEAGKDVLYARMVEAGRAALAKSYGEQRPNAQNDVWSWEIQRAQYLLTHRQNRQAAEVVAALADARKERLQEVIPLELRVAARSGTLAAVLGRYDETATTEILRTAATELVKDGDAASSRRVLEFVYTRDLKSGNVDASNFLGLAEIRLAEKDTAGALTLLRRMTLISGAPFSGLDAAAALLEKTGHSSEAAEFLSALVKAEPWNWTARRRLAAAVPDLTAVVKAGDAPYAARVAAALALRKLKAAAVTGVDGELALLSSSNALTESDVNKPYYYAARMEAASSARDVASREKLLAGAIAIEPKPEPPKIEMLRAALEARHDALAAGIAEQLGVRYIGGQTEFNSWIAAEFLGFLPDAERVILARSLADVESRLGDARLALLYYQVAQAIEPVDRVARSLTAMQARVAVAEKNEARRPVVGDHLDQDRLVRARVVTP